MKALYSIKLFLKIAQKDYGTIILINGRYWGKSTADSNDNGTMIKMIRIELVITANRIV